MTQITNPESKTRKLGYLIEECCASEKLTEASMLASEIDDWYQSLTTSIHKKRGWLNVRLTIGNQHFDLDMKTKSEHEAKWFKDMLDKALEI